MRRDLPLVGALALTGLLVTLLPSPEWLRTVLLVPLVLFLPGYALAANIFAVGTIGGAERSVYAVVFSIAVTAVGGFLIQVPFHLSRDAWAVLLAGVTLAAAVRGALTTAPASEPRGRLLPWPLPLAGGLLLVAAALAAISVVSATNGLHDAQSRIRFTSFWMLPSAGESGSVAVGVRSHEGRPTRYRLKLEAGGRRLAAADIRLKAGQTWEARFPVGEEPGDAAVLAELNREGKRYRRLALVIPR